MFWYLQRVEDRPIGIVNKLARTKSINLSDEEAHKLAKEIHQFSFARARYLYTPNKKEFWYYLQPHSTKAISGGNRSGKTTTNVIEIIMQCEGWHPLQRENIDKIIEETPFKGVREHLKRVRDEGRFISSPPIEARCVAVDFTSGVEKILGPEFVKWATASELKNIGYDNEKKRRIDWKNKSFSEFMSQDQELDSHGGVARDVIYFDEEGPYSYWLENRMRTISTKGRMLYGATAINGVTWTEEHIFDRANESDSNVYAIEMTSYDNPINTKAMIDEIKAECRDEVDVQIRIYGKRVLRGGGVYTMAREEAPWVLPRFPLPEEGTLIMAIDPHPKIEHAVLWIWVDYDGGIPLENDMKTPELNGDKPNMFEVGELFRHGDIPELAHMISEYEDEILGRRHDLCICDPAAWVEDQTKIQRPMAELLEDEGILPIKGSKKKAGGILKVKEVLSVADIFGIKEITHPRLMAFDDLKRLLWERKNYRWKNRRGKGSEDLSEPQEPVDRDDHMMENERRIVEYVLDYPAEIIEIKDKPPRMVNYKGNPIDIDFDEDSDDILIETIR